MAIVYALWAPPVYKAEAIFLPPTESDIQNFQVQGIHSTTINSVYNVFKRYLRERSTRRKIFNEMNLLDRLAPNRNQDTNIDDIFNGFNERVMLSFPKDKKNATDVLAYANLSVTGDDPDLVAEIANNIAQEAVIKTKISIIADIKAKISARTKILTQEIELLREKTNKERLDRIIQLETADILEIKKIKDKIQAASQYAIQAWQDGIAILQEAAAIARTLKLKDPIGYKLKKINEQQAGDTSLLTNISDNPTQLYTRGYEALEAEIALLQSRKSHDPFIPNLRKLQEQLKLLTHNRKVEQLKNRKNDDPFITSLRDKEFEVVKLQSIQINPTMLNVAKIDQASFPPQQRIKPKRLLIVTLGFALGLMLGVFVAFFVNFVKNVQRDGDKFEKA